VAQQPNIELDPSDLPRRLPEPPPPAPRRSSSRPGTITAPGQVPRGAGFGTPGPDTGYALRLVRRAAPAEANEELEAILAALMAARAAEHGRAPTPEDLEVAMLLAGLGAGLPEHLAERRRRWVEAAAHERSRGRTAVAEVGLDTLRRSPAELRAVLGR
jgi:hypothetical protein